MEHYNTYRLAWCLKKGGIGNFYSQWSSLDGLTVFDLDEMVKQYKDALPDREFWIEYK